MVDLYITLFHVHTENNSHTLHHGHQNMSTRPLKTLVVVDHNPNAKCFWKKICVSHYPLSTIHTLIKHE